MKIESKFNVGDHVWLGFISEHNKNPYMNILGPLLVKKVKIELEAYLEGKGDNQSITYSLANAGYYEKYCFASLDEAINFCKNEMTAKEQKDR